MRIRSMNWFQVEEYLRDEDRCVWPLGSTEQHAGLSLCVDAILAQRVAIDAAEPLGVPVYPVMPFGCSPYFSAYPGTVSLRVETLLAVARDVVGSMYQSGFRRVLIVNGHGGNAAVANLCRELMAELPEMSLKFHNWWLGSEVMDKANKIAPHPSHANWFENFPWTRLADVVVPSDEKAVVNIDQIKVSGPARVRELLGDGSFGGAYQMGDEAMEALWAVAVEETRAELERPWSIQL
ncbi:MAG: creatininase family protein [Gemmatimonadota bacterium]|nr:MAG: creatininase family protein [Gemmatimonadota bacterium]